jgi:hypothetical protein
LAIASTILLHAAFDFLKSIIGDIDDKGSKDEGAGLEK